MKDFLTNQRFAVCIGKETYGFVKVSNLVQEQEYECIREGGRNDAPLFFKKPQSKFSILTLERGMEQPLPDEYKQAGTMLEVGLRVNGVIIIIGKPGKSALKYTFDTGIVTKVEMDPLDAMGSAVLLRKVEIIHSGLRKMG